DGDGHGPLGRVLTDDIAVEFGDDLPGGHAVSHGIPGPCHWHFRSRTRYGEVLRGFPRGRARRSCRRAKCSRTGPEGRVPGGPRELPLGSPASALRWTRSYAFSAAFRNSSQVSGSPTSG